MAEGEAHLEDNDLRRRCNPTQGNSTPCETYNYNSGDEYAMAVRSWLWAYHNWYFSQYMMPVIMQQGLQAQQQLAAHHDFLAAARLSAAPSSQQPVQSQNARVNQNSRTPPRNVGTGVVERRVSSYGRRLMAEVIDSFICFFLKLLITYFLVEFELINIEKYEKLLGDESDLKTLIDVMHELFPYEVASKVLISILEALLLAYGMGNVPPGCTFGKYLVGIEVVGCHNVQGLGTQDGRILVIGAHQVAFFWALVRSFVKNMSLGFMLPVCLTMYFGRNNRAMYDVACGTVVVDR